MTSGSLKCAATRTLSNQARSTTSAPDPLPPHSLSQPECDIATEYCQIQMDAPFLEGQINPYDISKPCTTLSEDLCVRSPDVQPRASRLNELHLPHSIPRRQSSRRTSTSLG